VESFGFGLGEARGVAVRIIFASLINDSPFAKQRRHSAAQRRNGRRWVRGLRDAQRHVHGARSTRPFPN
jgi:hypothetical protein